MREKGTLTNKNLLVKFMLIMVKKIITVHSIFTIIATPCKE